MRVCVLDEGIDLQTIDDKYSDREEQGPKGDYLLKISDELEGPNSLQRVIKGLNYFMWGGRTALNKMRMPGILSQSLIPLKV